MRRVEFCADGIRGIEDEWPFTQQAVRGIGHALGQFVRGESGDPAVAPCVMIGRDTRPSGNMIAGELKNSLLSQGVDVIDLGIMTTPGVAYLTRHQHADLGVIVSASHNPPDHNGIKLVGPNGLRLQKEEEIEDLINKFVASAIKPDLNRGRETNGQDLIEHYIQDQVRLCPFKSLKGLKLVLDCANGAASQVAPQVFTQLDAEVAVVNDDLTGYKINNRCGSEHARQRPQDLIETVQLHGAAYGFAFDGDGDRLVIVDENGCIYNGDDILFILATYFHEQGELRENAIVTTDMANTGLKEALSKLRIGTVLTKHGDKHLEAEIWSNNYLLGSEQVGNIIINDGHHAAADPLYAALILSGIMRRRDAALHELVADLQKRPQVLASVHLASTPPLEQIIPLQEEHSRTILGKDSRVLIWYSSTEPGLFKVMVEGGLDKTTEEVESAAVAICRTAQQTTGSEAQDLMVLDLSTRNRMGPVVD